MNKKKLLFLLVVFSFFPAISFAGTATNEADPGSSFTVVDKEATPNELTFNFSPSVCGAYITPNDDGNVQAWTLGTYHSGGTLFYGTASNQAIVYKKDRANVETFADAGFPEYDEGGAVKDGAVSPWDEEKSGWKK